MGLEYHLVHPSTLDHNPLCGGEMEVPVHEVGIRLLDLGIVWEDGLWDGENAREVGDGSDAVGEGGEDGVAFR